MNLLILSGYNENSYLGDGWYGLERSPEGLLYKASKPYANLILPVEGNVKITLYLTARPEHTHDPLLVDVKRNGETQSTFTLESNNWVMRSATINVKKDQPIVFHTHNPWSPDALYQNGDIRALGFLMSSIHICN